MSGRPPRVVEAPCTGSCAFGAHALSADGRKVVYVDGRRVDTKLSGSTHTIIATVDLATGRVEDLESTLAPIYEGAKASPRWSPDGRRIVYVGHAGGKFQRPSPNALFVVDADGGNLREIVPAGLGVEDPRWSPDGALIVFSSIGSALGSTDQRDLYTVRPDGTDLKQLTSDGVSRGATWTNDGRIVFIRTPPADGDGVAVEVWIMDANGATSPGWTPTARSR